MLRVVLIGEELGVVAPSVEECRAQFALEVCRYPLHDYKKALEGGEPLLAFVEAPAAERGNRSDTWLLLTELQNVAGTRLVRAFVVSSGNDFDSEEAQQAWMQYGIVIGYEVHDNLSAAEVRAAVAEMVSMTSERRPEKEQPRVGSKLRMPTGEPGQRTPESIAEEYERHKFNSFLTGGVRSTLIQIREAAQATDAGQRPLQGGRRLRDPFDEKTAQVRFDEVAAALYGSPAPRRSGGPGDCAWLDAFRAERGTGRFAPHVLLLGETGTGKTLLARWMHQSRFGYSDLTEDERRRVDALFQDLNCGGISPNLIDSELFGGIAGAWSSLDRNTPGKIFCACCGTLFLDEIGEMPLPTQTILLKFLDDGDYYPVGGHGAKLFVPVTVIAATNRPIERLVEEGTFRRDLYERFRFRIPLPSLKDRSAHLDTLIDFVLQNPQINPISRVDSPKGEIVRAVNSISRRAQRRMREYGWPGNFRELEQVLWRAVFQARHEGTDLILPRHILLDTSAPASSPP